MLGLRELLRMGDVKRWHTVATAREQTLADHSCRVALIALRLYQLYVENTDVDYVTRAELFSAALLHDAAEVHLGDPPPAGKTAGWMNAEDDQMRTILSGFRLREQPTGDIMATVKMADRIEAWLWIRENGVGDHAKIVTNRCFNEMNLVAVKFGMVTEVEDIIEEIIGERIALCPF